MLAGGTYTLTPVANDEKSFLSFGDLSLCGVGAFDAGRVYIEQVDDSLVVEVRAGSAVRPRSTTRSVRAASAPRARSP